MKFDIVAGVSAGAINGALIAMDQFELLKDLWVNQIGKNGASEIYTSEFVDTTSKKDHLQFQLNLKKLAKRLKLELDIQLPLLQKLGLIFSAKKRKEFLDHLLEELKTVLKANLSNFKSIADNTPLNNKLKLYLDRSKIKDCIFKCGFVSLNTGTYHGVSQNDFATDNDFVNGVLSSASIPVVWSPVEKVSFFKGSQLIESHNNIDGGIMNVSPLGDVINMISEESDPCQYKIIIINCNSGYAKLGSYSDKSIGAIAVRALQELALTEIFNNDIEQFLQINSLVKQAKNQFRDIVLKTRNNRPIVAFDSMVISPEPFFELGNPLVSNEQLIAKRMEHGFEQAKRSGSFQ